MKKNMCGKNEARRCKTKKYKKDEEKEIC